MASEHRHPTGDTGTGAVIGTWSTRTSQYLVADVADVATALTKKTAEAAVGEGAMVQTPTPPTKTDRKPGAVVRTDAEEVGWRRRDDGLMGTGTSVGPAIRRPQEKVGPAIRRPQNISESCHAALTVKLPSRRSQNISVGCHRGVHYVH